MIATRDYHRFRISLPTEDVLLSGLKIRARLFDDPASAFPVLLQKDPAPGTCRRSCANAKQAPAFSIFRRLIRKDSREFRPYLA